MNAAAQGLIVSLREPRIGALRVGIGKLLHWRYRLLHGDRPERAALERIGNLSILVLPGVLNPRLMRTGEFFARYLLAHPLPPGTRVLDMGTGSGVCALAAARTGVPVVGVDINPVAVRCAQINAMLNDLSDRVRIVHSDLFQALRGERFDLILFNPPFIHAQPASLADRAWRSTDVAERFASGIEQHMTPTGSALVLLSTYGDAAQFIDQFQRRGLEIELAAERTYVNEKLHLLRLQSAARAARGEGE